MAAQKLPPEFGYEWTGMSFQEKLVGSQAIVVFVLAVLMVYLVLAAQYESWTMPAAVILVVPLALLGTVFAVAVRGMENNIYTQIGIVLIIALASKNAILIVEFARDLRKSGLSIVDAAVGAFQAAVPADLDDVVCVYPGDLAARPCDRGRRGQPPGAGDGRLWRHDRRDRAGRLLRSRFLRRDAAIERTAPAAAGGDAGYRPGHDHGTRKRRCAHWQRSDLISPRNSAKRASSRRGLDLVFLFLGGPDLAAFGLGRRLGLARGRRAGEPLFEPDGLARAITQIVQLGAPDLARPLDDDVGDPRRLKRELALDTLALDNAAHDEHFARSAAGPRDHEAVVDLDSFLVAFENSHVHIDGIADLE